jgi:pimeloyl-ACP methyl ester carboxylesterase
MYTPLVRKSIQIGEINISYAEKNPNATPTIIFIHGNSGSADTWRKQFADNRFNNYRLIAFDLPAHGASGPSIHPADDYNVLGLARVIAFAIQKIAGHQPILLVGFSLGSNIVAEMLPLGVKPSGITLVNSNVFGSGIGLDKVFSTHSHIGVFFEDDPGHEKLVECMQQACPSGDEDDRHQLVDEYFQVKPGFRSSLASSVPEKKYSDEIELLQKADLPLQCIFGREDHLVNCNYLDKGPLVIWKGQANKVPDSGHYVQLDQPEAFNDLLLQFAATVFGPHD